MRTKTIYYSLAIVGAITATFIGGALYSLCESRHSHKRSIVLLNKDVSITDSRATLDVRWLARYGYHSVIYLRHDGFMDVFDHDKKKSEENEWIRKFGDDTKGNGLNFIATGYHNRKLFYKNGLELRDALNTSAPPILIYSDKTRDAGVIWALAEAASPNGMPLNDILNSAEDFHPINQLYRDMIASVFKNARNKTDSAGGRSLDIPDE